MYIPITEDYRIARDHRNVILQRRKVNTRGKNIGSERWESIAFCKTYKEALIVMLNYEILVPQEYHEIVSKIDELMTVISALQLPAELRSDSVAPPN